jgi:ATP-binding cassette subfamily B (MDR/TAP) protein 1
MVFSGKISLGELLTAQIVAENINNAVKSLNFFQLRLNLPAAWRIFEIWDNDESSPVKQVTNINENDTILFEHVFFSYPQRPEITVLRNINFLIKRVMKIAIVGPNGSGKSSILKLLTGLYVPENGNISMFSKDIAIIEQDTFLFSDTFARNISCGDCTCSDRVIDAAKKAMIHDFIFSTKEGYASLCAAYGEQLSGGQRQRLSIARALYRNADIILLDEPTSALDWETSMAVIQTLTRIFANKTLIMITHAINLIKDFDRIYLMQNGEIINSGTHNELLCDESYRNLVQEDHQ